MMRRALASAAMAVATATAAPALPDAALEARARSIESELRCVVCQNQTLADSNAPLAVDLRLQIREQLARGASDAQVQAFVVSRYGDFVLYRPPFKATTLALWLGPGVLLVLAGWVLVRALRRQARLPRADPVDHPADEPREA